MLQDQQKAKEALELLTAAYPRDFAARNNLGVYYNGRGEFEEALKQYQAAATEIAPDEPGPISNAAYVLICLGRLDEAYAAVDRRWRSGRTANLAITRWMSGGDGRAPARGANSKRSRASSRRRGPASIAARVGLAAWHGRFEEFDQLQDEADAEGARRGQSDSAARSMDIGRAITLAAFLGERAPLER